jgi:hypothetical protein
MVKLKALVATALLTLPMLTLSASQVAPPSPNIVRLEPASLTNCCWVYYMHRWVCFPC